MVDLAVAVCSITSTKRRRYLWAAWWTRAPARHPFARPDASNGGAASVEEALREAEAVAGRTLTIVEPKWARAWNRVLRGMPPWTTRDFAETKPAPKAPTENDSLWTVLGVEPTATVADIKRAFRQRALETHPDRGGDAEAFMALRQAYGKALERREKSARRPKPRGSA
ncbi:MAG: J domain-containing protein [Myxococcales bacterium]|nr:J domain-containing protein [Myxococcales bacterium]